MIFSVPKSAAPASLLKNVEKIYYFEAVLSINVFLHVPSANKT
jgi:hypothetical protein